jgi:hypothetical protein
LEHPAVHDTAEPEPPRVSSDTHLPLLWLVLLEGNKKIAHQLLLSRVARSRPDEPLDRPNKYRSETNSTNARLLIASVFAEIDPDVVLKAT